MKVPKDVPMSSFIVKEKNPLEMPISRIVEEENSLKMPSLPVLRKKSYLKLQKMI